MCESCGSDAKVCLNCDFYDEGAQWQCRETISEPVREKNRANFCDFFRLAAASGAGPAGKGVAKDETKDVAKDAFSRLFGDE